MKINNLQEEIKIDEAISHFKNLNREEFYSFLDSSNDVLKQIALLNIENVFSEQEANKITNTLTDHPSETREYCSFLINRLIKNPDYRSYFFSQTILNNFERAIFDVNPKVCRKIIEILPYFEKLEMLYPLLIKNSFDLIELLEEKNKEKNYLYNKKSFHLYWHVFALGYTLNNRLYQNHKKDLVNLLNLLIKFKEYTIREKGAYLVKKLKKYSSEQELKEILEKYLNDENFYVKETFTTQGI